MPKLKQSALEEKNSIVRAYISKNMDLHGITEEDIAKQVHFTKRTFQNKRRRPETFTLEELRRICSILKFSSEEKAQLL